MAKPYCSLEIRVTLGVIFFHLVFPALAQPFSMVHPQQPFEPQIIGPDTKMSDPTTWLSTFVYRNRQGEGCTATAIGDRVILTAAHCISDGDRGDLQATPQTTVQLSCDHHPDYPKDRSADFALCASNVSINLKSIYEVVNTNVKTTNVGASVKLLGYGCRAPNGDDKTFGTLFEGDATVIAADKSDYIVTAKGAAVCFGDSGGGAYVAIDKRGIKRQLVAVNSQGDLNEYSWLSVTASGLFRNWAKKWAGDKSAEICGLDANAQGCRQ